MISNLKVLIVLAVALAQLAAAATAAGYWDSGFFRSGIQGEVRAIAVSGTDLYVVGSFTVADNVAVNNLARWNGTNWSALGGGVNGAVNAIAIAGTDVYVAGDFTEAGGLSANRVAKWDGTNWSALGSGLSAGTIHALAVSDENVLYVGGEFDAIGGINATNIAQWHGTEWTPLGDGLNDLDAATVLALAFHNGFLYAGGYFTLADGEAASSLAAWDGWAWYTADFEMDDLDYPPIVSALAASGTDLYVGGAFHYAGPIDANHVARWDGTNWWPLGEGLERFFGDVPVAALATRDNELLVAGRFESAGGVAATNLARWDGTNWTAVGEGASGALDSLAVIGDDLLVGGTFSAPDDSVPLALAQWNGAAWSALTAKEGQGIAGDGVAALVANGNDVYVAGSFSAAGAVAANNVARWDGANWTPLGNGVAGEVNALCWLNNDLFVGGKFAAAGGVPAGNVARWDGASWWGLSNGVDGPVYALAAYGGELIVGGSFTSASDLTVNHIARWDGAAWWPVGDGVTGTVYALAAGSNDLFVGGKFTTAGGIGANNVARWNGVVWAALGGGVSGVVSPLPRYRPPPVSVLAVSGNDLFVGGDFALAGGLPATNIARWNGSSWSAVGGSLPGVITLAPPPAVSALLMHEGWLYAGGSFLRTGGLEVNGLAQWDGTNWSEFGAGVNRGTAGFSVAALAMTSSGLGAGGHFLFAGNAPAANFSIWHFAPRLRLAPLGRAVQVSWPAEAGDYELQAADSFGSNVWRRLTNSMSIIKGQTTVIDDGTDPLRFYRLRQRGTNP